MSNTAFAIGLSFRVGAVDFPMDDASVDALLKAAPVALFIVDTDMALLTMPAFVRRELDRDLLVGFGERHGLTRRTVFYKPDGTLAGLVLAPQLRAAQGESAPHPPAPKI